MKNEKDLSWLRKKGRHFLIFSDTKSTYLNMKSLKLQCVYELYCVKVYNKIK